MFKSQLTFALSPLVVALATSFAASAEDANNQQTTAEPIERVSVTGSRLKRADFEGVTNVVSLSSDDMVKAGFSSVYDALSNLTAATGAIIGEVETGSYTPGAKELNLRGLGAEYTLVLINGKRMAYYPMAINGEKNFVNLDTIPMAMVERIDMQTGGASAVYGSDAMGGVINIITKKGISGHYVDAKFTTDTYDTADKFNASLVGGLAFDRWTLDYAFEFKREDALKAADRPYHDSLWDSPSPTKAKELNRSITVYSTDTATLNNYTREYCNTATNPHSQAVQHYIARNNYGYSCGWDETGDNHLTNQAESATAYFNSEYQLQDDLRLFANGFFVDQTKKSDRGPLFFIGDPYFDPDLKHKDGSQGAVVKYAWRKVLDSEYTDDGLGRTYKDKVLSYNFGFEGEWQDYTYAVTLSRSEVYFDDSYIAATVTGNKRFFGEKLGEKDGLPIYRPDYAFWFGAFDKQSILELADYATYDNEAYNTSLTAEIAGDLFELPAGPVAFSAYVEYLKEGLEAKPDERILSGEFSGLTGLTTQGDRKRYAAAIEMAVPVMEGLDIEAATRYDYYDDESDVGGAVSSQLGVVYKPTEQLVLRAAGGTTFRGPDLDAVYKGFAGNFGSTADRTLGDACVRFLQSGDAGSYNAAALEVTCLDTDRSNPDKPTVQANYESYLYGDKTLKEETGTTFTAGVVYEFAEYLSFNVDYYDITIKDKVRRLGAGEILQTDYECRTGRYDSNSTLCTNAAARITRFDENGQSYDRLGKLLRGSPYLPATVVEGYINASERQNAGVDFAVQGKLDSEYGAWDYKVQVSQVVKKKERVMAGDELLDLLDDQANFDFKTMANAKLGWQYDDTAVTLTAIYKGKMWNNANYGERQRLPAWTRYNLTIAQQIGDDLRLQFGINNLLNAMPPQDETFDSYPFYRKGAYDTFGRQFSLRATYNF
ncbi:TonB-dependent receptor domain-containing protein [Pseudoalteromonas fenneropenaei]|uniref:TonB-dependent receptor domain-containing protein n=1 Tax=Pseudoalteromonas fenneropenaei TaxID=1737459 RepID=A0ABV7CPV8_9GAMM